LPLPGGFTNFCGRIYGISKKNEDFKACLGLELRADEEVEAALRVSCFSFGPRGLKVMEAEPIPVAAPTKDEDGEKWQKISQRWSWDLKRFSVIPFGR
jgi:Domain of unknown function (DUF4773)